MSADLFEYAVAEKKRKRRRELSRINAGSQKATRLRNRLTKPEQYAGYHKNWVRNNREKRATTIRNYINKRTAEDPQFKLLRNLRSRLRKQIKLNQRKSGMSSLIGCSTEELKIHIESTWQPGMSWDNWKHDGWHIDHIVPLVSFDLTDSEQLAKACHYSNLQALWAKQNLQKGDR